MDVSESELPATIAYVPGVRGHAVLAVGEDADERESLAVWRIDTAGNAVGAWVVPIEDHKTVLTTFQGCGVLGDEALERLGLDSAPLRVDDLIDEVVEQRRRYDEANEQFRATARSKILPLTWPTAVTTPDFRHAVAGHIRPVVASPVAESALTVAGELRRAIDLWLDTEQVRSRRAHLRALGDVQPLPPRWTAALRAARKA